jgi:hypothetical protein
MKARLLLLVWLLALGCEADSAGGGPAQPVAGMMASPQAGSGGDPTAGTGGTGGAGGTAGTGGAGGLPAGGSAGTMDPPMMAGTSGTGGTGGGGAGGMMDPPIDEPPFGGADVFTWSTDEFTLQAGEEAYLCFASTLEEDLVINGYNSDVQPFVHHLIFSRARDPEPAGLAECDIAFRNGWDPVFISGAGDTTLEFPDDAGHVLATGQQMVVQMHLLNVQEVAVTGKVDIHMRRSDATNPRPVSTYIFGTAAVELPPNEVTEVVGTCPMWQPIQLIAGFPHMHTLGSKMTLEFGSDEGSMREVFKRDPFDFDNQQIDKLDVSIAAGEISRVTCTFTNDKDQTIGYGESTLNEMCYFIGFAIDRPSQSACLEVLPPLN